MEKVQEIAVDQLLPLLKKVVSAVKEVPTDVAGMKGKLDGVQANIHDADRMAAAEEGNSGEGVKAKVKQLVETSFRMEDIIDEYAIREERHLRGDDPGRAALPYKTVDFVKAMTSRLQFAYMNEDVKSEYGAIKDRNKSEDGSQTPFSGGNQDAAFRNLREAPLYVEEGDVVGFEGPLDELIGWMVSERLKRTVISLVGIGGQGKTTLAKKVFDNKKVVEDFKCHAWITVSQSYTVERLLRDMLRQLCKEKKESPPLSVSTMDRASLRDEVRNRLRDERYVVVFDDVWNESFWDEMEFALIDNKRGSKIFITTRKKEVAMRCMRSAFVQVHELQPLTPDKSFELFCKKAFGSDLDGHCPNNLKNISTEIVERCEGLPLATVAIGGLLSCKDRDAGVWQRFSKNLNLELGRNSNLTAVTKILGFSYHDLPYNLKQCFLYFGVYPEDYEIEKGRLIRQWVAEGFVKYAETETLEEVAEQYLTELINRSLVQVSSFTSDGKAKSCRVHDMLRAMILEKMKDLSFCHFANEHDNRSESGMIRRLTIAYSSNNRMACVKSTSIQSLHIFTDAEPLEESFAMSIPVKHRLLKVLDFEGAPLYDSVPESFGDLFLLRYLSFRNTKVTNLPRSIGMLHNLETLDLRKTNVHQMPREINKLKKLRHLLAYDMSKRIGYGLQMEDGIADGDLASLQTLREVDTNHGGVKLIKELERLTELRVLGVTNVKQEFTSFLCSSVGKMQHLEKLHVDAIREHEVIDLHLNVSAAPVLRKLHLVGRLNTFSNWAANLQSLVKLSLSNSELTDDPLTLLKDLPNLLCLNILYRAYEGGCLHFSNGGFQNLKQLVLRRLYKLHSIRIDDGALPSLKKFTLVLIPQLMEVPSGLYNLPKLEVFHTINMPNEFEQSIDENRGQHKWIKEQVPFVSIDDRSWQEKSPTSKI